MNKSDLAELSCREYAETAHRGWGEFISPHESALIYLHAGSRLRLTYEQHSELGFGFDRMDAIDETFSEHGVSCAERDVDEFTKDFIKHFCNYLSLHQLDKLIDALIRYRDEWKRARVDSNR